MIIGIPKERKLRDGRIALTPAGVLALTKQGISIRIEAGAGKGSGFSDQDYEAVGAQRVTAAKDLYSQSECIVKVNEPQAEDLEWLKKEHLLFSYLHLVANPDLKVALSTIGCRVLAYELLTDHFELPLLSPMSAMAGRIAVECGNHLWLAQKTEPIKQVVVVGAGVAGWHAVQAAFQMGADITVFDKKSVALTKFGQFGERVTALVADSEAIAESLQKADLVVGSVLEKGQKAEQVASEEAVAAMSEGTVIVDLSIDQGGCFETSKPTSLTQPTYQCHGVTHMCVPNLAGMVPMAASQLLSKSLVPYLVQLDQVLQSSEELKDVAVFKSALPV